MAGPPEDAEKALAGTDERSDPDRSADQRHRVLAAVVPVFARRGYQGTTVDDLLAAGGVGFGNFYSLFDGKEQCFLAAFDLVVGRAEDRMALATEGGGGWTEKTYLGLHSLIGALLGNPLGGRLVLLEAQSAGRAAVSRYNALMDAAIAWLVLGRDLRRAELPASYEQAAVSGLVFYLQQCVLHPSSHDVGSLLEEIATLLLEPVVGDRQVAAFLGRSPTGPA
jgi:AcrR family transcriptional regulator